MEDFHHAIKLKKQLFLHNRYDPITAEAAHDENVEAHHDGEDCHCLILILLPSESERVEAFIKKMGDDEGNDNDVEGVEALASGC